VELRYLVEYIVLLVELRYLVEYIVLLVELRYLVGYIRVSIAVIFCNYVICYLGTVTW